MRLLSLVTAAMLFNATTLTHAYAADAGAVVAAARQRIETTDSRATGRLVQVDASGNRVSHAFSIKARWFPGVLRALVEFAPSGMPAGGAAQDGRVSVLLEMRPKGQSTIRIFHPHEAAPAPLPFRSWSEGVLGSDFNYEDFLEPEYYWQGQTILRTARLGAHNCDVLKSTPGSSDHSHYAEVQTWMDQTIGYPIYVEKTPEGGGPVKEFTSLGLTKSGNVWAAKQVELKVHGRPGSTLLIIERGSAKANLTLKDFSSEQISRFEDHP